MIEKFLVYLPNGSQRLLTIDAIRLCYNKHILEDYFEVVPPGSMKRQTIRDLLESIGDLQPLTAEEIAKRSADLPTRRAFTRYADAYNVSRFLNGLGTMIKLLGVAAGIVLAISGVALAGKMNADVQYAFIFFSIVVSLICGIILFIIGIFLSAIAQLMNAIIDNTVHSSPFLSESQKASVMNLF